MGFKTKMLVMVVAASAVIGAQAPDVKLVPSPRGSAATQVGGTWSEGRHTGGSWITVDYGRPILRGRENIFGKGADYGKTVLAGAAIWRAGANETTRLVTQVPLQIGGKTIAAGEYNLLVDVKENAWTFVLSNQPIQTTFDANDKVRLSGATNYDPKFDLVRAPMRLTTSPTSIDQFTIGFADVKPDRGSLYMAWDRTVATVDFTVGK